MTRPATLAGLVLLTVVPLIAQQAPRVLTTGQKLKLYLVTAYGPQPIAFSAASAGFHQWVDTPHEWGQGMRGYGRRVASRFAQNAIEETTRMGIGLALHEDPRYIESGQTRFWARIGYALKYTLLTRRDNGGDTIAVGRICGVLAGGLLSRTWQPDSTRGYGQGIEAAGYSFAADAGNSVFREFWPDIRRRVFRKR
ncbi:MAG: hypothetical protein IANPNBLG_00134 [Bryobacteraceae bacterium]|nr:hypothetical protein [Bryobacteraceae bacterium]